MVSVTTSSCSPLRAAVRSALHAWQTNPSGYPDANERLVHLLGREFNEDELAILFRAMRGYAKSGFNAHFVDADPLTTDHEGN